MAELGNQTSVFKDRNRLELSVIQKAKWLKIQQNLDMITKIIDDIFASESSTSPHVQPVHRSTKTDRLFYMKAVMLGVFSFCLTTATFVLKQFYNEATKNCGLDRRCEQLGSSNWHGVASWRWTLWLSSYPTANVFFICLSRIVPFLFDKFQIKSRDIIFIVLTNAKSIVTIVTRGVWFVLFYVLIGHDAVKDDALFEYTYAAFTCIIIFNVLVTLRGMLASYLDLSLHVSSQTLKMTDSMFREETLYNLTNYYLYDDRYVEVPSFKGQQHIHASVLRYVSTMKMITPDLITGDVLADDVSKNISDLQKKLVLLLNDTIPAQLRLQNIEYSQEEFNKWLEDIQCPDGQSPGDVKVQTTRTIVDKWKLKTKRNRESTVSNEKHTPDGSHPDASIYMSNYALNNLYDDMLISINDLHYLEVYTDEALLKRYTGEAFENLEAFQEFWDLEAKKLGFFIFWTLKQNENKIQVSEANVDHVFKEYGIDMDASKIWDMLDTDDTLAVDLSECVRFVTDTFNIRRDLARTILDSKAILRQLNFCFDLCIYFVMIFVILEVFKIARFQNLWQAFSASLIAFSFIFGNSLKEIWENLVYLFTIHAFDVGDIIILSDTRYTVKTISLTHVGCTRVDNASFTIPMQSFVGQELNNITRSGCKWEGFSMLVDVETTKDQLSQIALCLKTHISSNKRHYGGLYRIFFVPTDGLVHKLKMAIYFNYSQNESDLMLIGVGRTMLHDAVTRAMNEVGIRFTLPDFSHAKKSRSQAREMDHMDYQNYAVAEDRVFNVGLAELG